MRKLLSIFCTGIIVAGCESNSNIKLVKDGVMDNYKSLTIGVAFDNWQVCDHSKSSWEEFKTSNGIEVVQYTCTATLSPIVTALKSSEEKRYVEQKQSLLNHIEDLKQRISQSQDHMKEIWQRDLERDQLDYQANLQKYQEEHETLQKTLNLTNITYKFQWVVNKDDSFELSHNEVEYQWGDRHYTVNNPDSILNVVYQNKNTFLETANSIYAYQFMGYLQSFYNSAK